MIYLTSDHGGFHLKEKLAEYLTKHGFEVSNEPPHSYVEDDDYPDYLVPVMEKVQNNPDNKAIVICRNGVGVGMLANKFERIKAGLSWNPEHAKSMREDDNTNVLALPSDYISEEDAFKTAEAWLNSDFSNEERHNRRLAKVDSLEQQCCGDGCCGHCS